MQQPILTHSGHAAFISYDPFIVHGPVQGSSVYSSHSSWQQSSSASQDQVASHEFNGRTGKAANAQDQAASHVLNGIVGKAANAGTRRKAARSTPSRLRARPGVLKELKHMPLDIVFEVVMHLHPRDVLHLARTDRTFRSLLMDRSSKFLWKAARANVEGLPECPPNLDEPGYAHILPSIKNFSRQAYAVTIRLCILSTFMCEILSDRPRDATTELLPRFVDIALEPDIKHLANAPCPRKGTIVPGIGADMRPLLRSAIQHVQTRRQRQLIALLGRATDNGNLRLAAAVFVCDTCQAILRYPFVLAHKCLYTPYIAPEVLPSALDYEDHVFRVGGTRAWSCDGLRVAPIVDRIRDLIRLCGKDPDWTAQERFEEMHIRLCLENAVVQTCTIMSWDQALRLEYEHTASEQPLAWRVASYAEAQKARFKEEEMHPVAVQEFENQAYWCCGLCFEPGGQMKPMSRIRSHVNARHPEAVQQPATIPSTEIGNVAHTVSVWYLHPDAKPMTYQPVVLPMSPRPTNSSLLGCY